MVNGSNAIAIAVLTPSGRRYFYGFGNKGQLQTAWSLAGAKLFGAWQAEEVKKAERQIEAKGYRRIERVTIGPVEGAAQ